MGILIKRKDFCENREYHRLLIFGFAVTNNAMSMNNPIAVELLKLNPRSRSIQLEQCFTQVISALPNDSFIKDIDVMFNPSYNIDVLSVLVSAYRKKPFKLIWPGRVEKNKLIYSQEGYSDYRVFNSENYDVICVY